MTFVKFEHYVKLSNILPSRIYVSMNLSYIYPFYHKQTHKTL
jgi:hypothetical protein